jgi:hypothetical protein
MIFATSALEHAEEVKIVPLIIMTPTVTTGNFLDAVTMIDGLSSVRPASVHYPVGD